MNHRNAIPLVFAVGLFMVVAAVPVACAAAERPVEPPPVVVAPPAGPPGGPAYHIFTKRPPKWRPRFQGIDLAELQRVPPMPLRVHAVRIDLTAPGIRFLATPSNGDRPKETDSMKVSTFLVKNQCQVAVNGSPFAPVTNVEGDPQDVVGLSVSDGDGYSKQHPNFASLVISRNNRVQIIEPPADVSAAHNAVGGFGVLLRNGENVGADDARHPRTAAGVSEDGRYLFLLVIDGRQPDYSMGATTRETGEWLRHIGAYSGLNLDGGGSTALAIADGQGGALLVNRPIHTGIPGTERPVGNHLGVFAKPLARTGP